MPKDVWESSFLGDSGLAVGLVSSLKQRKGVQHVFILLDVSSSNSERTPCGGQRVLRAPCPAKCEAEAPRSVRYPDSFGQGMAGSGWTAMPNRCDRRPAGRWLQLLEPAQSTRALLGCPDKAAPKLARNDFRPTLVDKSLSAADADDYEWHGWLRSWCRRRPVPRSTRLAMWSVRQQNAYGGGVRLLLPL